ncbi:MAG: hypothetical protein NC254_07925 [bacterium]|nr:hypothetical protein [bacterium]
MKPVRDYYYFRYMLRVRYARIWDAFHFRFSKRKFLQHDEVNAYLKGLLLRDEPCMACRIGANESFSMRTFEFKEKKMYEKAIRQLCVCAGFFPEETAKGEDFLRVMKEALAEADLCGTLMSPCDDYFLNHYTKESCRTMFLSHMDATGFEKPWTEALRGKKVLIVHPFAETIRKQYPRRKEVFPDREIMPDCELTVYKAVQTAAGQTDERYTDWFAALEAMTDEIGAIDFDVALLACGAYGLPLAANIKRMGKKAVHIGGGLQLMFGIRGKRWDDNPEAMAMYNDAWVYPSESETPKGADMVEGACYWR